MIIHQPETRRENGKHIVSAVIEYDQDVDMPSELWFRVDEEFASHVSTRADAFVSCLLSVARELREDIEIRADFSPQLLIGLQELQYIQEAWFKQNRLISLKANNLVPSVAKNNNSVNSCNISGGVDSSYTLWSLLPENQPIPELQIHYGIFGEELSHPDSGIRSVNSYGPDLKRLVNSLGVEFLAVGSNLPLFTANNKPWLALSRGRFSIPMLFSSLISTHFKPSSNWYEALKPSDFHPMLDHLFSIESLRIFPHAANLTRFQKLKEISNWPPIHEYFQVCNVGDKDALNCCRCNKCYRTMIALDILGVKENFNSFHLPLRKIDLLKANVYNHNQYVQFKLMVKHAWSSRNLGILPFLYFTTFKYRVYTLIKPLINIIVVKLIMRKTIKFIRQKKSQTRIA